MVRGIDEENLISKFYTGLKQEMKEVIKMKEPKGLRNHIAVVIKMASSMVCRMIAEKSLKGDSSAGGKGNQPGGSQQPNKAKTLESNKANTPIVVRAIQHLTPQELAELKRLKLCFKCKEK